MSLCEWDPERGEPARIGDGCERAAVLSVGANGQFHLCAECAALPRFKRFRRRVPLVPVHRGSQVKDEKHLREEWRRSCAVAETMADDPCFADLDTLEDAALRLVAVARYAHGVACEGCSGHGRRCYANTTGWRGGIGGQMITASVCDRCWGSGRSDRKGVDVRRMESEFAALRMEVERLRALPPEVE